MDVLSWWGVALTSIPLKECNLSRFRNAIEIPLFYRVLSAVAGLGGDLRKL